MNLKSNIPFALLIALGVFIISACNTNSNGSTILVEENVVNVFIDKDGNIFTNGEKSTLEEMDKKIEAIVLTKGSVKYSRESKADEPHPNAMKAISVIVKHGLPIQFYKDNTFKEVVTF